MRAHTVRPCEFRAGGLQSQLANRKSQVISVLPSFLAVICVDLRPHAVRIARPREFDSPAGFQYNAASRLRAAI